MERIILEKLLRLRASRFNRPEVVKRHRPTFCERALAAGKALAKMKDIRVVLVTGAGRGFCSGIDLKACRVTRSNSPGSGSGKAMRTLERSTTRRLFVASVARARWRLCNLPWPATCASLQKTRFSASPLSVTVIIPGLGTFRLPRALGLNRGKLLALVGRAHQRPAGLEWGVVDKSRQGRRAGRALNEAAGMFLQTAPTAFRESKKLLTQCFDLPYNRFLEAYLKAKKPASPRRIMK